MKLEDLKQLGQYSSFEVRRFRTPSPYPPGCKKRHIILGRDRRKEKKAIIDMTSVLTGLDGG